MSNNYLLFAGINGKIENFFTIEGEGRYAGYPSVFMRFFGCNLTCISFASKDSPHGCDSYISWSQKNKRTFDETFTHLENEGFIDKLQKGAILKLTGGEPFLRNDDLLAFIKAFVIRYGFRPHIDFETNGTIMPNPEWVNLFDVTFTTSPKLSNNGDPLEKRYKPEVLRYLVEKNACFKFVVQTEKDIEEIYKNYINEPKISLPKSLIWLMPMCGSREEQNIASLWVAEKCMEHNFKFSPRLQLLVWDKAIYK